MRAPATVYERIQHLSGTQTRLDNLRMQQGRLMLDNGSSGSCRYRLRSDAGGRLWLQAAFFTPHGQTLDEAMLEFADGESRRVRVTFGPRVDDASFIFADEPS